MNWTGGGLSRAASRKQKTTQQKQRAYFARAKASLAQRPQHDTRTATTATQATPLTQNSIAMHNQTTGKPFTKPSAGIDPDEYNLLQKRQELLRRPDWLSLQVTKPVRIDFASRSDKALIGRRRKVSTKPRAYERAAHNERSRKQPQRTQGLGRIRSYADILAPQSSYDIKIGTGALNSNITQHAPTHQQGHRVVDLNALSEEPTLLDSDDDLFERHDSLETPGRSAQGLIYGQDLRNILESQHLIARSLSGGKCDRHGQHDSRPPTNDTSSGVGVPWSTSIIDVESDVRPSNNYLPSPEQVSHDARIANSMPATMTIMGSQYDAQILVPRTQQKRSQAAPVTSRSQHVAPSICKPAVDDQNEELWRSFIIGNRRSESEDSSCHEVGKTLHKGIVSSVYLTPAHHKVAHDDIQSNVATQGIADHQDMASHIPLLSSTASIDKTTRGIASSASG